MSAPQPTAPTAQRLASWFDSDLPSRRTRALELWSSVEHGTVLYSYHREQPSEAWSPPRLVARRCTLDAAQLVAEGMELDRYLIRDDAPAAEPAATSSQPHRAELDAIIAALTSIRDYATADAADSTNLWAAIGELQDDVRALSNRVGALTESLRGRDLLHSVRVDPQEPAR